MIWQLATTYSNSQTSMISFNYSGFLAKNVSNFEFLPWKILIRYCHILGCTHGDLIGDGNCNDESNTEDCIYDGDDCCGSCPNTELCTNCACLGNLTGNGYSNSLLGNGICEDETNTLECAYDGLDCCGSNATMDHCTDCACYGKKIPIL